MRSTVITCDRCSFQWNTPTLFWEENGNVSVQPSVLHVSLVEAGGSTPPNAQALGDLCTGCRTALSYALIRFMQNADKDT
jgi:hypothetical protein